MKITIELEYSEALERMTELMDINPEACTAEYGEMIQLWDAIEKYEEEHEPWSKEVE